MKYSIIALAALGICSFAQTLKPVAAANPSPAGGIQPNWALAADGSVLLSWVEPSKDGSSTLRYAVRKGPAWSEARTIAPGRRFWRHPAEVPELLALPDGTLLAHWVENGKDSTEAEYIFVSTSRDGTHWSEPAMAHKDRSPVQHGLASVAASGPSEASIFWLQALKGEDGPVSLMRTVVGADGKEIKEEQLDADVCSCCPTSVVKTAKGLMVVYRSHNSKDIRDIAVLRFENGKWSPSKILYPDKWEINACPVNAASAAAKDNRVAVAWYTEADDKPRVQFAFSSDAGATFAKPIALNTGDALGYASTVLNNDGGATVSWLEEGQNSARVMARVISPAGAPGPALKIAEGPRQSLGYPKLIHAGNDTWIAWGDAKTGVKTAVLN
ncbi:MAG: exo-alpha-sialidase [Bryobacterales bacterium]|nr:exo-alpha-sialidase [Bryobacterales bacterium]MBV9398678.1 exo-alpha-sialidase [Bryobacterales bacterium]